MKTFPKINYFVALFIYTLIIAGNVWWSFTWLYHQKLKDLAEEGASRLELYSTYLQGVLEKYENFPELLANDRVLVQQLAAPNTPEKVNFLNRYLEKINRISHASDIYLMDSKGMTIAASNWQEASPFVGQDFGYRPYFHQAMQGRLGRYFALGKTSSIRGYYFAYPIWQQDRILGALVLKINIDSVENNWGHDDQTFIVTDSDGVIFLSTNKDWRFHTIIPLTDELRQRIIKSQRYPDVTLKTLDIIKEEDSAAGKIIRTKSAQQLQAKDFLLQTHAMEQAGWDVHVLTDTWRVERFVFLVFIALNALLALSVLVALLIKQRRQRVIDLKRFEDQARRVLEEANEQLETRVIERTQELTQTNTLLRKEIEDRKRVEQALRNTRSELVHAAKMAALGQMSAGINHELNQPLAAIRSYSDNGRQFLAKGRSTEAMWNLEQISELTDRMAQIGVQLKQFSRKTSGQLSQVPLHSVIDGALEILNPVIRKTDTWIKVVIDPEYLDVRANYVLLQQVLVNLVSNALHAVEGAPRQEINIRAYRREDTVIVSVADSGPGIAPDHLPHIFEPFFTTKQAGQGLGLGLTITERILHEMNGGIIRVASTECGAKFECFFEEA
ncbi:MAG: hypothetical protein LBD10_06840 [Desulfobulbus sp.]|uniref:sensor histidine kinase n=1 Tax=Desulfobulbus sp. TaxID=895 RepID=UPI00284264B4|nr:ATP-binding protein [Desulfobulbus sp.]MDR2549895.1 hypothetical protein [Desulfobulbus sp.]